MKGFRSFAAETRIDFPESGLVLIRGQSSNGDSSGCGKSTILLAIGYALDMCPFPASELQSWLTEDAMQVQVGFDSPQGPVVISRGKKNSLKIGDQDPVTGAKAISEGIQKLFGLDTETLRAITYRPQDARGLFLALTDAGKKEFLTRILGLNSIESAVDASEAAVKALTPAIAVLEGQIRETKTVLESFQSQVLPEPQDLTALSAELERLRAEYLLLGETLRESEERARKLTLELLKSPALLQYQQLLEAIAAQGQKVKTEDAARFKDFQTRQAALRLEIQEVTKKEALRSQLLRTVASLETTLKHAQEGKCPTCHKPWEQSAAASEMARDELTEAREQLAGLKGLDEARRKTEGELRETFVPDPTIAEFARLQTEHEAKYQDLKRSFEVEAARSVQEEGEQYRTRRAVLYAQTLQLSDQIQAASASNQKVEQLRALVKGNVDRSTQGLANFQKQYDEKLAKLNQERDFLALLGNDGFLGVIFDDVLREIETEANERLGRLANVSHCTIQFKSEVETQKGTVNKKITPVVFVNGVEAKLKSGLSGGMYTSVEGVVDLAVMSVVQQRTGALPGFLFLDESFNGQGKATKEATMEVLRDFGQTKLVVVIDHNSEFKEMFSQFIDVTYKDGYSEVS